MADRDQAGSLCPEAVLDSAEAQIDFGWAPNISMHSVPSEWVWTLARSTAFVGFFYGLDQCVCKYFCKHVWLGFIGLIWLHLINSWIAPSEDHTVHIALIHFCVDAGCGYGLQHVETFLAFIKNVVSKCSDKVVCFGIVLPWQINDITR